ncbi:ABC transporter ATP-binding protein [Staphylococcus chromogenes]|nr:ABC transporter ATP-binding protein [Staphylococcus chromogenes]
MSKSRIPDLWQIVKELPFSATAAAISTVGVVTFEALIPLLTGDAVDVATGQAAGGTSARLLPTLSPLTAIIVVLVTTALARFLMQFGRRYTAGVLSINVQHRLRLRVLDALQLLDGPGQDRIRVGQIVSRSISDINMVQGLVAMFPLMVGHILKLLLTVAIMLWISPLLAAVALAALPLIIAGAVMSRKPLFAATWSAQQEAANVATHVEETVTGVRVVKAFAQEDRETDKLEALSRSLYAQRMRAAKMTARFQPLLDQLPQLALVVNVALGGWLALKGEISIGTFVAFSAYLTSLTGVARMLSGMAIRINMASSSVTRVFEVLDLSPEIPEPANPARLPEGPLGLVLDQVTFADRGRNVLDGLSLHARPGETLALVGPPGSGKTMAVQLMGKFYAPDSGRLALTTTSDDMLDYKGITKKDLRTAVIAVYDEAFLFSASIRDNITMGGCYTDAEVERAARAAQAHDFISDLQAGYQEVVGERGLTLSGGQRQRIALARAFLARPRILILDDATSAIDASTEARIYAALRTDFQDVTIIAVAHRQSTLDLADRVALIENGRLSAAGPLAEMRHNPRFAHLMDVQFQETAAEALPFDDGPEPADAMLWPATPVEHTSGMSAATMRSVASMTGGGPGNGRGGGGRDGRGAMMAAMPATPELLAEVAKLPPATEEPKINAHYAREDRSPFRLRPLFRQVRWLILAAIACLFTAVAADLAFPTLVRHAIDAGVVQQQPAQLWTVAGIGAGVVLVSWLVAVIQTVLTARTGERLLFSLRLRSYAQLNRLSMDYFERTMSGRIMTRMTTDIDALSSFLQTGLAQAIVSLTTLLGITAMLLGTNAELALVALASLPILILATIIFRRVSSRLYALSRDQISTVNALFQENISGIRIAQTHGREPHAAQIFAEHADSYRRSRIKAQSAVALYFPGINLLSELSSAAVVGVGAHLVLGGEISPGVLVAFIMYMGLLFGPIQQLSQLFDGYQQAQVGFTRIRELLDTAPSVTDHGTTPGAQHAASGPLALEDVSFSYTPELPPVTEGFSLTIAPGSTVALVGHTGAGKSTTIKLLARFYDPTSGRVTASGQDIRDFPLQQWRSAIGQVPQEAHLFSGSIADNIAYGRPSASKAEITDAARRVGALTAIATIPGGFNYQVGERGRGLSSGQRQLIALARAEMLQPKLMLLDEATATLDPATEATILNASDRVTATRTSVIVAHRLATAARADRILVIDKGRIIEDGTHATLLELGGRYADMWNAHK